MPDMNKALTLNFQPTWHQQKAAQSLNYLADFMKHQPGEMEQTRAWETLSLGEFGLEQLNLLVDHSPSTMHDQILEVEADPDPAPGLVTDPIVEEETDEAPGLEECTDEVEFETMSWNRMCDPMTPAQMALIHQTERVSDCTVKEQTLTDAVHADNKWQEQFQLSNRSATETESDPELTKLNEPVGLFGLYGTEPCLVTGKKYTLWPHMHTYVQCTTICLGGAENGLYLCEALPKSKWVTAEGLIDITFNEYRWAHIDNNTDEAFDLGIGMEVGTLK